MHLIIIGTGLAGYTLVKEVRKIDQVMQITMITNDEGSLYSKPMLSTALSKNKQVQDLIQNTVKEMEEKYKIKVMAHTKVKSINTDDSEIDLGGTFISYDSLVLAVGANPFRPKMEGNASKEVLSINNLDDYEGFRGKLDQANKVIIIGPGLIGCEFANDLTSQNKEVHLIGPDPYAMSSLLSQEAGEYLQSELANNNVHWHLNALPEKIDKLNDSYEVLLNNGEVVTGDLIISAVGLRANIQLVIDTEIEHNKAILVDEYLQTNLNNVYAIGDCAQVNAHYLPFVAPILAGSKALAKTLTGDKTKVAYKANSVTVKTSLCPLVVAKPSTIYEEELLEKNEFGLKLLYLNKEQEIVGYILMGEFVKEKQVLNKALPDLFIGIHSN
jgi:rubredoxin-NAD+ reductase